MAIPNTTPTPNELFNGEMRNMSDAELRVVLIVTRATFGWILDESSGLRKEEDWISHSQMITKSGKSSRAISYAVASCIEKKYIEARSESGELLDSSSKRKRHGRKIFYRLGEKFLGRIQTIANSTMVEPSQPLQVTIANNDTKPSQPLRTTKETLTKETLTKLYDASHRTRVNRKVKSPFRIHAESDEVEAVIQTEENYEEGSVRESVNGRSTAFDWPSARERWNKVPHQAVIIRFLEEKGIEPESQAELGGYAYQYKHVAAHISAFTPENINAAFKRASKWEDWSLSTVLKEITK